MHITTDSTAGPGRLRVPRRLLRLVLVLAALVLSTLPSPAEAHTELVASTPAQGERVSLDLDRLVLTFRGDLLAAGAAITVQGPGGEEVPVSLAGTFGASVDARLALEVPGRHTVMYRVVGADGHVIAGRLWFTVVAGAHPGSAAASVSRDALPGASATADAPGSVMWLLLAAVLLVAVTIHRVARRAR
ncbi:copper resistance CopC family protein [Nocardioides sp. P5_C9_2]